MCIFFPKKTDMVGMVDVVELCETVSEIVLKGSKNVSVHSWQDTVENALDSRHRFTRF